VAGSSGSGGSGDGGPGGGVAAVAGDGVGSSSGGAMSVEGKAVVGSGCYDEENAEKARSKEQVTTATTILPNFRQGSSLSISLGLEEEG